MKTVLILDDEQVVRESFSDFFEDRQWHTVTAESAEEALELLKNESPDGAVVDVRLPGMDGGDFIREAIRRKIRMAYVICTGSPEYFVPKDLAAQPCVSENLFKKPVIYLSELETEIIRIMDKLSAAEDRGGT